MKRKHSSSHSILSRFLAVSLGLTVASVSPFGSHSAQAAESWTGATNGTWGTNTNWSGSTTPTTSDDLTILGPANAAGTLTINIAAAAAANTINFTDTSAVTLSNTTSGANQTLTLQNGLTTGTGAVTIGSTTANQNINIGLGASQTWTIGAGGLTVANVISGTGFGLDKTGTGALTLNGANTYSGGTTISGGGTIIVGNASALGTGALTLNGGSFKNATTSNITNNIVIGTGTNTITEATTQNFTLTGALSGAGNVTFGGGGGNASIRLQFSSNTMTSGQITLSSVNTGVARLNNTASSSVAVDWVISGATGTASSEVSGTFNFGSFGGSGNFNAYNGNSGTTLYSIGGANHDTTYSGLLSANGTGQVLSVLKVGTGAQTFSGANSWTGTTTVQNGSLIAGRDALASATGAFGNTATAIVLGDATTISSGTAMNPELLTGGAFTIGRAITVGASNGALGNAGTTFTIGGNTDNNSTFSGTTTLNQNLTVSQVATTGANTLSLTGNITSGASGTQTITFNNVGSVSQSTGVIGGGTGTIGVTQSGTGTTTLSGANTYTGATTVNGGTLKAGVASVANTSGAFGNNSAVTLANSAGVTLDITGFNTQIGSLAGGGATGGNVTLGAATLTTGGADKSGSYAGVISGTSGSLTKIGTGTQTLTGSNTYTGATTISGGILQIGNGGTSGSISGTSGVTDNATLAYNRSDSLNVAYSISGSGNVKQIGAGTTTVTGNNSYSGTTTISSGTWKVNGLHSSAGAYTVQNGGTLGGSGTITTAGNAGITLDAGAKLSPGNSPGTLTADLGSGVFDISAGVSATNSQSLLFDLTTTSASDRVLLSNASSTFNIGTGKLEFDDFVFSTGAGFMSGNTYTLFDSNNASGVTGSLGSLVSGTIGLYTGTISIVHALDGSQDIVLTVTAVPEPATCGAVAGLLLSGLSLTSVIRRRRRATACGPR